MSSTIARAVWAIALFGVGGIGLTGGAPPAAAASEFQVNTFADRGQSSPAVVQLSNGRFVVVWRDDGVVTPDPSDREGTVSGQLFAGNGAKIGTEFVISRSRFSNAYVNLGIPGVAPLADGSFIAVWSSDADDEAGWGNIHGQRMSAEGTPLGKEFKINRKSTGPQQYQAVSALAGGGFVVAWASSPDGSSNVSYDIFLQRFSADGKKLGPQVRAHAPLDEAEANPAVAGLAAAKASDAAVAPGGFLAVWDSTRLPESGRAILGQFFAADGTKVGDPLTIYEDLGSQRPRVAVLRNGSFVVV